MLINSLLKNKPTIYSETVGEEIIHLGAITFQLPDWMSYTLYKVSKAHVARPDLISRIMYGTDIYGDLICKANGISNPFEINEGDIIVVPDMDVIPHFAAEDLFDDTIDTDGTKSNAPKPKQKNEKRKANEAIVGDTRFKVDKDNRVIIY